MKMRLHKEYGVNSSVDHCFWCGEATGVVMFGHNKGKEAPRQVCTTYTPCDACAAQMDAGITFFEATTLPQHPDHAPMAGAYPTGRYCVVRAEALQKVISADAAVEILKHRKTFIDVDSFTKLFGDIIDTPETT